MCMLAWDELISDWWFKDRRLYSRYLHLLQGLLDRPGLAFSAVFGKGTRDVKTAYNFCENKAVNLSALLEPAYSSTGRVIREQFQTVLVPQDGTEFDLTSQRAMSGLGEIGNPKCRGILLQGAIAVTPDGLPIGPLSMITWVRDPLEHGKSDACQSRGFEDKESVLWWKTAQNAERAVACPGRLVHIGDRGCDVFDVMARCAASGYRFLFRAAQDRVLRDATHAHLWEEAESWPVVGSRSVDIPERPAKKSTPTRAARTAQLALRYGSVKLAQPYSKKGFMTVSVVFVREVDPASPTDVIEWMLLTNDVLSTPQEAWTRVDWYRQRWLIEEWHKCMKTTCRVEERQLKARENFETYLAMVMLVSLRILFLRNIARIEPETPAQEIISEDQETVLRAYHAKELRKCLPPALNAYMVVRVIAMLGGFLARKGDGEPGFQTLARGYSQLAAMVRGYRLTRGGPPGLDQFGLYVFDGEPPPLFSKLRRSAFTSPH